jgi:tryptophan halogenase
MKIVIVGGGTAGWLAALILLKTKGSDHTITMVESSNIGIIGAGEGSTGTMTNIIQNITGNYGCDEQEFISMCDVTPKLGIHHKNWTGDNSSYIAPIDGSWTSSTPLDFIFLHTLANFGADKIHLNSDNGLLIENNKDTFLLKDGPAAYHFDAHKVGKYFKKVCGDRVKHVDSEVKNVNLDENGFIKSLDLSNEQTLTGDFFVDATGFSRVLMKKLNVGWHSYKNNLPVDRAMPFLLDYEADEVIKPLTVAWAQKNGWMWQIPTLNRKGCGYVYSSEFTTDDQAHAEIETILGRKVNPIKFIKFESGRSEKLWEKNCLSIGLAAAFAEPLEATSIHTTIVQLEAFAQKCLVPDKMGTCDPNTIQEYNNKHTFMYDLLKDFLVLHYQGGRTDSEFWKYIDSGATLTEHVSTMIGLCQHRVPNSSMFPRVSAAAGWPLWSYVLAGTGKLTPETARKELEIHRVQDLAEREYATIKMFAESKITPLVDNTIAIRNRQRSAI